jgi:hypothetical protein
MISAKDYELLTNEYGFNGSNKSVGAAGKLVAELIRKIIHRPIITDDDRESTSEIVPISS